jgi:hypothetical protein
MKRNAAWFLVVMMMDTSRLGTSHKRLPEWCSERTNVHRGAGVS